MPLFIYKLELNAKYHSFSAWDEKVQIILGQHADYLQQGLNEKKVLIVGRTDTDLKDNFGLAIFEAENLEEAKSFMEKDPAILGGVMRAEAYPFKLLMVADEAKKWNVW